MPQPIRIAIAGAAGRMGRRVTALAAADARFRVVAALEAPGSPQLGVDAGSLAGAAELGVPIAEGCAAEFDVMIDYSAPGGTIERLKECESRGRPIVVAVTGHTAGQQAAIDAAASRIAVLQAANLSVGANEVLAAVERLAAALGAAYDVEIVEAHHRQKVDAPSGTALALRDAVLRGRGTAPAGAGGHAAVDEVVHGRSGRTGVRPAGQIGIHAVRGGEIVGEHEVRFEGPDESVIVRHVAHSRDAFARGALAAAAWIVGRPPGRYSMCDLSAAPGGRPGRLAAASSPAAGRGPA